MTLIEFKKIVQETAILTEDAKARYLAAAESYTEEQRTEMVNIIREEEQNFLAEVKKHEAEAAAAAAASSEERIRALHEKEAALKQADEAAVAALEAEIATA